MQREAGPTRFQADHLAKRANGFEAISELASHRDQLPVVRLAENGAAAFHVILHEKIRIIELLDELPFVRCRIDPVEIRLEELIGSSTVHDGEFHFGFVWRVDCIGGLGVGEPSSGGGQQ